MLLSNKDQIFINDLTVYTIIGADSWERALRQPVILNLTITINFSQITNQNSNSSSIIDHKLLINTISDFCNANNFRSLELLVLQIEQLILSNFSKNITELNISAKKLFESTNVKEFGVKIARTYVTS